jgi:TonB-dependent SusC/RagA subfamily outer membrane receptor
MKRDVPLRRVVLQTSRIPRVQFAASLLFWGLSVASNAYAKDITLTGELSVMRHLPTTLADQVVTGTVSDEKGDPLPGVSIVVKGQQRGTNSDTKGQYRITVPDGSATLIFSFVGYLPQEVLVGNQSILSVTLKTDSKSLEEVIVVGYGTQKKVNLTGAVDQVTSEVLDNRSLPNLSQGLQGTIPNLNLVMGDGKPTQSPTYNIRGTTSIGQGGSALVLIDGVEGDPSRLNPNDVATVSVLKDAASAAIYGARGAFGVVLITTKNPNKRPYQHNVFG